MKRFLVLGTTIFMGGAIVFTAYILSRTKIEGRVKASLEKITVLGRIYKFSSCINESTCYYLDSKINNKIYLIDAKDYAWVSLNKNDLEKIIDKDIIITGFYMVRDQTSYIVPIEIK